MVGRALGQAYRSDSRDTTGGLISLESPVLATLRRMRVGKLSLQLLVPELLHVPQVYAD